jgi:uncharacterized protein (DUF1800 family)
VLIVALLFATLLPHRLDAQASSRVRASPVDAPRADASLGEDEKIRHVLGRLGFGPRPGDVERVRRMGLDAYIELQLHPERIEDSEAEARLAGYPIANMSFAELRENDLPAAQIAVRMRSSAIERRLDPAAAGAATMGPDGRARAARQAANPLVSPMVSIPNRPSGVERVVDTRLLRAVYSERQLVELMVDFWMNHFNIFTGDAYLIADFENNVIRPGALGNFQELLLATAQHPAMLIYLDNWLSTASGEDVRARVSAGAPSGDRSLVDGEIALLARRDYLEQAKGLNENYARELMELHTLGVDGGYTQDDVIQVARAFTGWTITGWAERQDGEFVFDPALHTTGDKVLLGRTISSAGMEEGLTILDLLAHHPSTARFIATKLARRLVADDPPEGAVDAGARAFLETNGDLRSVVRAIVTSPAFYSAEVYQAKVKKPIEMVASALRAVDADIETRFGMPPQIPQALERMGEQIYGRESPDGYPDVAPAWISTNALFQRLQFAMELATGQIPGIRIDEDAALAMFDEMGYSAVTLAQIETVRGLMAAQAQPEAAGGAMMSPAEEMSPMMGGGGGADGAGPRVDERLIALAIALGSPEFQKR